jgi:peroxiredoxin
MNLLSMVIGTSALPYEYFTPVDQLKFISILSPAMQNYPYIQKCKENALLKEQTSIGKTFRDFELRDTDGNTRKLSDFVGTGRLVLLDFWASFCGPCKAQFPKLAELYTEYHSKGFEIVGVSLDLESKIWNKSIQDMNLPWVNLSSLKGTDCPAAKLYGVDSVPSSYLINSEGIIIKKNIKPDELSDFLHSFYTEIVIF